MCSGSVNSSCSTSGTRRVNLVRNPVISHECLYFKSFASQLTKNVYCQRFECRKESGKILRSYSKCDAFLKFQSLYRNISNQFKYSHQIKAIILVDVTQNLDLKIILLVLKWFMLSHCVSLRSWVSIVMSVRNSASKTMFGSSLPAVVCRTTDVLSYLVQFDSIKSTYDCVRKCYKYSCGMCFIL